MLANYSDILRLHHAWKFSLAGFILRLPMSLAMMRVLLVQAHGLPWGFTAQHVVELQRVPAQALMQVAERLLRRALLRRH